MTPRKPDRFEKMVRKEQRRDDWGLVVVPVEDAIKLLRNEHAWMRRMVRQHMQSIDGLRADLPPDFVGGYMHAGHEFLNILAQRRK